MVLLDAINSIELFLNVFVSVYLLAIFLYVLLSWFRLPYSLQPDPALPVRRLRAVSAPLAAAAAVPGSAPIDLTPMVAILALLIASRVVIALLDRLH